MNSVLYVGSGRSALRLNDLPDELPLTTCAVNNAWRLFKNRKLDYWIHPGDFPKENFPEGVDIGAVISHPEYSKTSAAVCDRLVLNTTDPEVYLGYTIFFQGLYWVMEFLRPREIYMLGFDHDYDPEKVKVWQEAGEPSPVNNFANGTFVAHTQNLSSAFYGMGTPDPMRFGERRLRELFDRARRLSTRMGVTLYNSSGVTSGLNQFPQRRIPL